MLTRKKNAVKNTFKLAIKDYFEMPSSKVSFKKNQLAGKTHIIEKIVVQPELEIWSNPLEDHTRAGKLFPSKNTY